MHIAGLIFSAAVLLLIFIQDLRHRAVSWVLFPIALLALAAGSYLNGMGLEQWLSSALVNLAFLAANLLLLLLWFALKGIGLKNLLQEYMGVGDVLFFGVMAFGLPFPIFPVLFVLSLVAGLLAGAVVYKGATVPLAGIQALTVTVFLILHFFHLIPSHSFMNL